MTLPTIHLNGTSRDALVEQRCAVADVLREARRLMDEMAPHLRDYPNRAASASIAVKIHETRVSTLEVLIRDISDEATAIADMEGA